MILVLIIFTFLKVGKPSLSMIPDDDELEKFFEEFLHNSRKTCDEFNMVLLNISQVLKSDCDYLMMLDEMAGHMNVVDYEDHDLLFSFHGYILDKMHSLGDYKGIAGFFDCWTRDPSIDGLKFPSEEKYSEFVYEIMKNMVSKDKQSFLGIYEEIKNEDSYFLFIELYLDKGVC
jgi:hypothetical protein